MGRLRRSTAILTPLNAVALARLLGALGALGVVALTLGPFQGLEKTFGLSDKAAHAIAFYGLTLMAFTVAPARRRTDLAIMVLAFGLAIEVVQGLVGRSASVGDILADTAGVALALAPGLVERLRHHVRNNPSMTFSDIADLDRRRRVDRRIRASGLPKRI